MSVLKPSLLRSYLSLLPLRDGRPWRFLAFLALVLMDLSWLAFWYCSLPLRGLSIPYARAFLGLGSVLLLAWGSAAVIGQLRLKMWQRRLLLFVLIVASLFIGMRFLLFPHERLSLAQAFNRPIRTFGDFSTLIPAEFAVFVFLLYTWWRGMGFWHLSIEPLEVLRAFRLGIAALILYGLLSRWLSGDPGLPLAIFLFSSLLALSTARIYALSQMRGGRKAPFDRQWLVGSLLAAAALVALALLTNHFIRSYAASLLGFLFSALTGLVTLLVFVVLVPPLTLFIRLLFRLGQMTGLDAILAQISAAMQKLLAFFENLFGPEWTNADIAFLRIPGLRQALFGLALLILILIVVAASRIRADRRQAAASQASDTLEQDSLLQQMLAAFRKRLREMAEQASGLMRLRSPARLLAAARIRRIYFQLLNLSAKLGRSRPASRTPLEFLPTLEALFPALGSDLQAITQAYLRVRYGELPETLADLEAVENAWRNVASEGRALLRQRSRSRSAPPALNKHLTRK